MKKIKENNYMAVPVQTHTYPPQYQTMTVANSDAGSYYIVLSSSQCNLEKGFSIQTGTLTDAVVTVEDSLDGSVWIDNSLDYLGVAAAVSNQLYKCELKAPVHSVRVKCFLADATNAAVIKVLAPNR